METRSMTFGAGDVAASGMSRPPILTEQTQALDGIRITQGQLDAIAMRCREELDASLRRTGTAAVATLRENVLTVCIEHSLAAAEHQLMRREVGRAFFQHYIEELAEQMYPDFLRHVEGILPCTVTYTRVRVDCENDCILFVFGLRRRHRDHGRYR